MPAPTPFILSDADRFRATRQIALDTPSAGNFVGDNAHCPGGRVGRAAVGIEIAITSCGVRSSRPTLKRARDAAMLAYAFRVQKSLGQLG